MSVCAFLLKNSELSPAWAGRSCCALPLRSSEFRSFLRKKSELLASPSVRGCRLSVVEKISIIYEIRLGFLSFS